MRHYLIFLVAILCSSYLYGQQFHGAIAEKYPILMELELSGKKADGTYQYKKIGKDLMLKGHTTQTQTGDYELTLEEFDSQGKKTGVFQGILRKDNQHGRQIFSGSWINPRTKKSSPFVVIEQLKKEQAPVFIYPEAVALYYEERDQRAFLVRPRFQQITRKAAEAIEAKLSFDELLYDKVADIKTDYADCACGTISLDYDLLYQNDSLITLVFQTEFLRAYLSYHTQYFTFNYKTGKQLTYSDFIPASKEKRIFEQLNKELAKRVEEMEEGHEQLADFKIDAEQVKNFSLDDKGITFHIEYPLSRYLIAIAPDTDYFVSWKELK